MGSITLGLGRVLLVRTDHDADLIKFITDLAKRQQIDAATFTAVGAVKTAKLAFYDQQTHQYTEIPVPEPCEIVSCTGNISIKDDQPFVHAHAVLANKDGHTKAGHLVAAQVFAAEVHLFELWGQKLERKNDSVTGLALWDT